MPATSEKQRKFMALVHAIQTGKASPKKAGKQAREAASSMTKSQSRDFMQKKAEVDFGGRKPVDPSKYLAVKMRRMPTEEDKAIIDEESSKWFPDVIKGSGEPIAADMTSPSKGALLWGLLGGALGGAAGKGLGMLGEKYLPESEYKEKIDPDKLAVYGGATTAALAGMLAYYKRHVKNKELEDQMLRLPPGATRRDRDWNPAFGLEYDPEYISRVAQLNAALMGRLSPKAMEGFAKL